MKRKEFLPYVKLIFTCAVILFIPGCHSLDKNEFCIFGKDVSEEVDYSSPVIVDLKNNKIPWVEQRNILKKSRLFSNIIINDNYEVADYLCANNSLPLEEYKST